MPRPPPRSTLFPYTTLFRSDDHHLHVAAAPQALAGATHERRELGPAAQAELRVRVGEVALDRLLAQVDPRGDRLVGRSEEHTSELQSQSNLVCRLLLEKKKK